MNHLDTQEDVAWLATDPHDLWIFDKLILSRRLGYICGPAGVDVPHDGFYIVRPAVNCIGLGLGAYEQWLTVKGLTDHLSPGTFWCEMFEGDHISVDYEWGQQILAVQGFKPGNTFTRWDRWVKVNHRMPVPKLLQPLTRKYHWMNCEYIGGKLIEVHLRRNPDFDYDNDEFIPVWQGQDTTPPAGYRYVECPELHKRIGAWVK